MKIETERLIIRSLTPADEQAFIEMASDGSLTEIYGDCSECHKWMGQWIQESIQLEAANNPNHGYLAFVVEEKRSGQAIGSVGTSYYEDMREVGITYFVGAKFRCHGYMAEAVRAFTAYFFRHYDADTLFAATAVSNIASHKTLERAGFVVFDTKMYQDMFDDTPVLSHFYKLNRKDLLSYAP